MSELLSVNPFTGEVIHRYAAHDTRAIDNMLDRAVVAGRDWKRRSASERLLCLDTLKNHLLANREEAATCMVAEMGKLYREALAEVDKCVSLCDYYLSTGLRAIEEKLIPTDARRSGYFYEPQGVILGIMPWNFPFWQAFRFLVPALLAGNTVVLKHAGNVSACSLFLERIFASSFPMYCMQAVLIAGANTAFLVQHPAVAAVSLTGSEEVGRKVAALAGAALKPLVLELGGSDPLIVFEDADVQHAAQVACVSRFQNAGQSCIAAKRFLLHHRVQAAFIAALKQAMEKLQPGNPMDPDTGLAPLAKKEYLLELDRQVGATLKEGARLITGGEAVSDMKATYLPTLIEGVTPEMTAGKEELFGPVAAIMTFQENDEAIHLANSTRFGLGSSIFTFNETLIAHCKNELHAGSVYVNGLMKSHPALPFGGAKASGFGRELADEGLKAFSNIKTFWEK